MARRNLEAFTAHLANLEDGKASYNAARVGRREGPNVKCLRDVV